MTVMTLRADRIGIFLYQVSGQCRRAICRPCCFVRRMFRSLCGWLGGVMTVHAGDWLGQISAAIFGLVFEVVEGHLSQLSVLGEHNCLRRFTPLRGRVEGYA